PVDWLMLSLGSSRLQDAHWATVVSNVVRLSEGAGTPVESDGRILSNEEAREVERWIGQVIARRLATAAS
ncbi:MAG: hypothetical protein AB7I13_08140, partial [Vicinamibacterales bacterium]